MLPERPEPQPLTEAEALMLSRLAAKLEAYAAHCCPHPPTVPVTAAKYNATCVLVELASTLPYLLGTPNTEGSPEELPHIQPEPLPTGGFHFRTWNGGYHMVPARTPGYFAMEKVWEER